MDLGNMVGPSSLGVVNQAGIRLVDPKFAEVSRQIAKIKLELFRANRFDKSPCV
jgi:hypothetical protein